MFRVSSRWQRKVTLHRKFFAKVCALCAINTLRLNSSAEAEKEIKFLHFFFFLWKQQKSLQEKTSAWTQRGVLSVAKCGIVVICIFRNNISTDKQTQLPTTTITTKNVSEIGKISNRVIWKSKGIEYEHGYFIAMKFLLITQKCHTQMHVRARL